MSEHGTFVCAQCGGTFDKTQSDADALAEAARIFTPQEMAAPQAAVCDDCWRMIVPGGKPIRPN